MKKESEFQKELVEELSELFPGVIVFKTDANQIQGFPDLMILWGRHWAALETKRATYSSKRPNQMYYVDVLNAMSFSSFINPENKERVLHELQRSFKS
jgi:hypothetical protein